MESVDDTGEEIGDDGGRVSSSSAFAFTPVEGGDVATWRGTERRQIGVSGCARGRGPSAGAAEVRVLSHWTSRARTQRSAGVVGVVMGRGRVPVSLGKARDRGRRG